MKRILLVAVVLVTLVAQLGVIGYFADRNERLLREGLPVLLLAPIRIGEHEGWADGLHPRPDASTTRLIRTGDDTRKSAPPALRINPDPPIRQGAEVLFPYVIAKAEDREVRKLCRHADPKILAAERIVRIIGLTCEPTFDAFSQQPLVSVRSRRFTARAAG